MGCVWDDDGCCGLVIDRYLLFLFFTIKTDVAIMVYVYNR